MLVSSDSMTEGVFIIFQFVIFISGPCVVLLVLTSLLVFVSLDSELVCYDFGHDLVWSS